MFRIPVLFLGMTLLTSLLSAQTLLQDAPKLSGSFSFQQSTYDRTGFNDDRISPEYKNYYDVIPEGKVNNPDGTATGKKEYVLCHVTGPAVVERFWLIPVPLAFDARFRFYFDGETVPRISKTFNDLFLQQSAPFIKPLVQNLYESSGGFWSYIQLPVAKSLIVTIDTAALFGQFGIRQLPRDTMISSWTAAQDNSFLVNEFSKSGSYPKNNLSQTVKDSAIISIAPQQTVQVLQKSGSQVIEGIQMQFPDLDYSYSQFIKDKGNFHRGTSRFTLKINGNADSVLLIKRSNKCYHLDFNFKNLAENALIRIDNQLASIWRNADYRSYRFWKNDTFRIPRNLYQGKNQLTVSAQYLSGEPWNEAYYWISCNGVITDSLDVGTPASESAHSYTVNNLVFNFFSELNNRYDAPKPVKQKNRRLLDSVFIKIYFDNETTPSVLAPIGMFFATGVNDVTYMKSLPCGNVNGEYYNYFSMPFWQNARIELENRSSVPVTNALIRVLTAPNDYSPSETGYLKTVWRKETKTAADNTDYLVAAVTGKGSYLGTVIEANQNNDTVLCWLEGDERIYIDGARSPSIYGTGTEDYFNSTFYFYLDEYSLQQNGMPNSDAFYHRSMYRFHLTDPIRFEKQLRFSIEHGDYNNKLGNYQSLAFIYLKSGSMVLTDSLDVGNTLSEQLHQYTTPSNKVIISKSSAFEGVNFQLTLQQDGYAITDSSEFHVAVHPNNKGVRLMRTFDYSVKNQQAEVYADDSLIGIWLNAGSNTFSQFREEFFDIPERFTENKSTLKIKVVNKNSSSKWTELTYKVFSIVDSSVLSSVKNPVSAASFRIFPTLTNGAVTILPVGFNHPVQISIYTSDGSLLQQSQPTTLQSNHLLDLSAYPSGTYFITISQEDKVLKSEKVLLLH
jgi:hypothetical protein